MPISQNGNRYEYDLEDVPEWTRITGLSKKRGENPSYVKPVEEEYKELEKENEPNA